MSLKKIGVVKFLGTNCDRDVYQAIQEVGRTPEYLWYQDQFDINSYDALVIPGGFSYGDYLRTGALAARAPVMKSVSEANKKQIPILGICNGFQILCEAGLLPGVLLRNQNLKFIDEWVNLKVSNTDNPWTKSYGLNDVIKIPIAHGEGRFFADNETLKRLQDENQILCTYEDNPNGSCYDIAGVLNEEKNIVALMPHPERAIFDWAGSFQGKGFFTWLA